MTESIYPPELQWKNRAITPPPPGGRISESVGYSQPQAQTLPSEREMRLRGLEDCAAELIRRGIPATLLDANGNVLRFQNDFGEWRDSFTTSAAQNIRCTPDVESIGILSGGLVFLDGPLREDQKPRLGAHFPETTFIRHSDNHVVRLYSAPAHLGGGVVLHRHFEEWEIHFGVQLIVDYCAAPIQFRRHDLPFAQLPDHLADALTNGSR